jgi:serine/threonine protein phosphatase 1
MRTLVIGDIHGNLNALRQVLVRSGFDPDKDRLISLGDVFDGHPYSADCVEELMMAKDFIWCMGNHDAVALSWFRGEWSHADLWKEWEYGEELKMTIESYHKPDGAPDDELIRRHAELVRKKMVPYFIDEAGRFYVHAGIDWNYPPDRQPDPEVYYTDRNTYAVLAQLYEIGGLRFPYKDVFIGHTKTIYEHPDGKPVRRANLWNLDTGAGTYGKLTIMDADTYEYWQSDWGEENRGSG